MIDYINDRLNRLAAWQRTGNPRLGYASHTPFADAPRRPHQAMPLPDDEALVLERAVAALPPELLDVVVVFYRSMVNCTAEQMAQALGIHRDTLYARLHRAHERLKEAIEDAELAKAHALPECQIDPAQWGRAANVCGRAA